MADAPDRRGSPESVTVRCYTATVALVLLVSACGAKTPDYQAIWTTPALSSTPTSTEAPVPISAYLESVGVTGEAIAPDKLTDLTVTLPRPAGWGDYHNPNYVPGTEAIAKANTYPTAMVLVFKLNGSFDTAEAIRHGYADAELSQNFKRLNASTDNFRGFPSAMIEGSYDLNGQRLHSYNRIVIATGSPQPPAGPGQPAPLPQRYLVQLTVTTIADQAVAQSTDVEAIIRGFTVAAR
jgi:hypothetical protein